MIEDTRPNEADVTTQPFKTVKQIESELEKQCQDVGKLYHEKLCIDVRLDQATKLFNQNLLNLKTALDLKGADDASKN